MKKIGFTLMELLLVIGILAIVAAVAAPQFFRSGSQAMTDARLSLLKTNYAATKAAIKMRIWDEANNTNLTLAGRLVNSNPQGVLVANSRIGKLVESGYLQENATAVENGQGQKLYLAVYVPTEIGGGYIGKTDANPYDQTASVAIFMESTDLFGVAIRKPDTSIVCYVDIDLKAGRTWEWIYNNRILPATY